jgi:hypothetical protein
MLDINNTVKQNFSSLLHTNLTDFSLIIDFHAIETYRRLFDETKILINGNVCIRLYLTKTFLNNISHITVQLTNDKKDKKCISQKLAKIILLDGYIFLTFSCILNTHILSYPKGYE